MYAHWIPQNIQKRLLLYILQQLAFFSEVDLPNLEEVSLNNIQLRDIAIDPEKVSKIPGFSVRHGKLQAFTLKAGVVDGVHCDATGLDLVVAPSLDTLHQDLRDAQVSLAQSTADLTQTVMLGAAAAATPDTETAETPGTPGTPGTPAPVDPRRPAGSPRKPSSLGGVMSRALEIALSRLHIRVRNVSIRVLVEPAPVVLTVDEICFSCKNGVKSVSVKGVKMTTANAAAQGHRAEKGGESATANDSHSGTDSDSDSDSDSESGDSADLTDSMIFTHAEASSLYMSATAESFSNPPPPETPTVLFHIDTIQVSFEQLSDLKIDVHSLKVAAVPLVPSLSLVLHNLAKSIKLKTHHLRKGRFLSKTQIRDIGCADAAGSDEESDAGDDSGSLFDKIHIANLVVSLTAALDPSGDFASLQDELSIVLSNLTLKQKDKNLTYGGVESVEMLRHVHGVQSTVFSFTTPGSPDAPAPPTASSPPPNARAEVRFEYLKNPGSGLASELTVLVSKPASCLLDSSSVQYILDFISSVSAASENFSTMVHDFGQMNEFTATEPKVAPKPSKNQVILQTASFDFKVKLNDDRAVKALVFPVSYNKLEDQCHIHKILIHSVNVGIEKLLLTIPSIRFTTKTKDFSYYSFASCATPRNTGSRTSKFVQIGAITGSIDHRQLLLLVHDIAAFTSQLKAPSPPTKEQHANNLASSIYTQSRLRRTKWNPGPSNYTSVSLLVSLKSLIFDVHDVNQKFGGLKFSVGRSEIVQLTGETVVNIHSVALDRVHDVTSSIVTPMSKGGEHSPMIQFCSKSSDTKSSVEIVLRKAHIHVHAEWQKLLSKSDFCLDEVPDGNPSQPDETPKSPRQRTDIRLSLYELALGISPGRLPSKLVLMIGKGSSELIGGEFEMQSKSSVRDIEILLIDDVSQMKELASTAPPNSAFMSAGFVSVGKVNTAHIGLNVLEDVESVKRIHELSEGSKTLSNISFKLNLDDIAMSLCADSAHTLAQTINDLKEPVVFKDEDKFRLGAHRNHYTAEQILDELKNALGSQVTDQNVSGVDTAGKTAFDDTEPEDAGFHIVDQYYDEDLASSSVSDGFRKLDLNDSASKDDSQISIVEGHFSEKHRSSPLTVVPLSMEVNFSKTSVLLFDGYDWKSTRKSLRRAVQNMEKRASELAKEQSDENQEASGKESPQEQPEEEDAFAGITETLFQSVHISTDQKLDVPELVQKMNYQMQGESGEANTHNVNVGKYYKNLVLHRSRCHKILLEIKKIGVTVVSYTARDPRVDPTPATLESEVVNRIHLQVETFTVFDNVPTSTWNRFLTYMSILGDREVGSNMLSLSLTNVRPDAELAFTEAVIDVQVLPVRLHIDQDTLEFLMRFGEFKDSRFSLPLDELVYVQKMTIHPLRIKFDYKPKKIDYTGIRAGKNAELINFFILDGSDVSLKKAVIYGAHGFTKVGEALAKVYAPYVQKNQVAGLLSGLTPVKSIFNLGNGVRDLVAIPVQEYKRDGRLMYGIQKGTKSFAKATSHELLKLGIKLASGTQVLLETSEEYFGGEGVAGRKGTTQASRAEEPPKPAPKKGNLMETSQILSRSVAGNDSHAKPKVYAFTAIDEDDSEPEFGPSSILAFSQPQPMEGSVGEDELVADEKSVSLYSNQPSNVGEGLRSAYKSLGKNLQSTRKKLVDLRHELKESDSLQEQLATIAKSSPVIVIRPIIGTTEAMMKTLMGVSNGLDSSGLRENHDKYRGEGKATPTT